MISISRPLTLAAAVVLAAALANAEAILISTGKFCTYIEIDRDELGNVIGQTTTSGPCSIPQGVTYFPLAVLSPGSPNSPTLPSTSVLVPQFVDGGGWQTTLVLANTTASAATASVTFYKETGAGGGATEPWTPTFLEGGSTQNLSLAAGATLFLHTPGTSSTLTQGWGQATASDGVQIYAVFRTTAGGQGTASAVTTGNNVLMPFDNTGGNVTSFAVANPTDEIETLSVSFQSSGGAISHSSLTIPAYGHEAFAFPTLFPGTANGQGLAEFYAASGGFALIGLLFDPVGFSTAQVYTGTGPIIIGAPDPEPCWINPFSPPCPQPPFLLTEFQGTISSSPVQITITPATGGTYNAAVSGTVNGAIVSGTFGGGTITNLATSPSPITLAFTKVSPGATFTSGSLSVALAGTAFDASVGEGVGNATGSITLNQANVGSGTISGAYTELVPLQPSVPAPALTFSLQSQSAGTTTDNLSMAVSNTGTAAATNVTITSITGITASGATFVYVPGLLNPPFVVPGAASLAPGATSGFNLIFQATSGSAETPFSFVIAAKADNVPAFTTTINTTTGEVLIH
jgi:hypothetical protein